MTVLSDYQTEVTDLLHDSGYQFYSEALVTRNINAARRQVARRGQCIRVVPTPGTGVDELHTVAAQERYPFSTANAIIQGTGDFPGVGDIVSVCQVCVSWGGIIPAMTFYQWNRFNAWFRAINVDGIQGFPACWSQYGQGASGIVALYPIPTSATAMLWDCMCDPLPLVDDTSDEAIPSPFTEAVKYYAAKLCYQNSQRKGDAADMEQQFMAQMRSANSAAMPWMIPDWYKIGYT